MAKIERFTEKEIPYGKLERFGLTQEMIDDLPQNVMQRFLSSRKTPLLPVFTINSEGKKVQSLARISLVRLDNGEADVCFAPQWEYEDLTEFTPQQQEKLKLGDTTIAEVKKYGLCFVQFDDTVNQVMTVPVDIINQNISTLAKGCGLNDEEVNILKEGGIAEIDRNGKVISIGIDLNEKSGIRAVNGDIMAWREDAKADELPKYNFGNYGCWIADDDNILSYVNEDDFDEILIREQGRAAAANAAGEQVRQMKMS